MFFIDGVIDVLNQLRNNLVDLGVFVGGLFRGPGNNQGRARFVDKDGVHFIDDGEVMAALDAIGEVIFHVVAKIVEAKFVVRTVSNVGVIRRTALSIIQIVHDHANAQAQRAIQRAHPLGVAARQIIVDGNDVYAAPSQRIQTGRQGGHQRFSFAGFHFGDFAFVQDHATDQLHVEMAHVQEAPTRFAHQRKCRYDRWLQGLLHQFAKGGFRRISVLEALLYLSFQLGKAQL